MDYLVAYLLGVLTGVCGLTVFATIRVGSKQSIEEEAELAMNEKRA